MNRAKQGTFYKLKLIFAQLRRYRRSFLGILALILFTGLLRLPVPFLTQYLIDDVILKKEFEQLLLFSMLIIGMSAFYILADFVKSYYTFGVSQRIFARLQTRLLAHAQQLPVSYFHRRDTGYLVARFADDLGLLNSLLSERLVKLAENLILLAVGASVVLYIHWQLALAAMTLLPFYVLTNVAYGNRLREMNREVQERKAHLGGRLNEMLQGILTIKVCGREKGALRQIFRRLKEAIRVEKRTFVVTGRLSMLISFLGALGPLVILCYGGYEIMQGRLTLGELMAFNVVLAYLFGPSQSLAALWISTQRSLSALDRVVEILETAPEASFEKAPGTALHPTSLPRPVRGQIRFADVHFAYGSGPPVLDGVSFEIPEHSITALVGGSGAGKSTVVSLLLRFYEPGAGAIYLDGLDLRQVPLRELRKTIALVSPEAFLFNTSILENIRFGRCGASDEEAVAAAQMAHAHDFISGLPQGYDTAVGRMGYQLSAGQRQRVALARAFLRDPCILVLDEATSSVDSRSEELIWRALRSFVVGRTTLVISHRLSTLLSVDHVLQLDGGIVVAAGKREDVMAQDSFQALYKGQVAAQPR